MMNHPHKPTVTVEDLLRLKRAERPNAEFWAEFDQELRAKQLAALVAKRPWWSGLPRRIAALARYNLPLGATAVLAITLISLRNYEPVIHPRSAPAPRAAASAAQTAASSTATQMVASPASTEVASPSEIVANEDADVATADTQEAANVNSARLVPVIQTRAEFNYSAPEDRPSIRSVAENRAAAEAILGTTRSGFEARALPVKLVTQEPLARIQNPSEARRSRFASTFAAAAVGTSPIPTARVASRLSDEQLYDTIHRFGASGNSVSFKF
jgi:hypothetical protein